jgi:RHS repeat-associated protein
VRSYVWGNDLSGSAQGAGGVGGLLEVSYYGSTVTNVFPAFDGNGNVAALINAADGSIAANYEYAAFGEVVRTTGPMAKVNPIRFSTKYQDDESDLLYYGYRYYKASTGSWPNRDPLEELGAESLVGFWDQDLFPYSELNPYGFVANNPIGFIDRFGLAATGSTGASCPICDPGWQTSSINGFSSDDVNEAGRIVYAEASCNSDDDQLAAASVLRNRIGATGIPPGQQSTFDGVINAPGQFPSNNSDKFKKSSPDKASELSPASCQCLKKALQNAAKAATWGSQGSGAIYNYNEMRAGGAKSGWDTHGGNRYRHNPKIGPPT